MGKKLRRMGETVSMQEAKPSRYRAFFQDMSWWMAPVFVGLTWLGMQYLMYFDTRVEWSVPSHEQLTIAEGVFLGKAKGLSKTPFPYEIRLKNGDVLTFACWPNNHRNFCLEEAAKQKSKLLEDYENRPIRISYFYLPNRRNARLYNVAMEVVVGDEVLRSYQATREEFIEQISLEEKLKDWPLYSSWGFGILMLAFFGPGFFMKLRTSFLDRGNSARMR